MITRYIIDYMKGDYVWIDFLCSFNLRHAANLIYRLEISMQNISTRKRLSDMDLFFNKKASLFKRLLCFQGQRRTNLQPVCLLPQLHQESHPRQEPVRERPLQTGTHLPPEFQPGLPADEDDGRDLQK